MVKTLISSPPFIETPLPSLSSRHGLLHFLPHRRLNSTRVKFNLHDLPPIHSLDPSSFDFAKIVSRARSLLYTLADTAVSAVGPTSSTTVVAAQKSGGWFEFISETMEVVLKVLKDGLTIVHVPYAYGFAIILLIAIVKIATFPLIKKQVESTLTMHVVLTVPFPYFILFYLFCIIIIIF